MAELQQEMFAAQLHTRFQVHHAPGRTTELELVEIRGVRSTPHQELFVPTFAGPEQPFLPQQTYWFEHPVMGRFEMFIVPIGRDERGFQYEAVFNRLLSPGG